MSRYPQNTYVGMRYVPLFDGDWNNAKDYEPLTVVSLNGNSYTSKTFVPAGASPAGNPDYWAETGNYNAQIEAYRQEVLQYNARIQANADAIAALETKEDADIKILDGKINTRKKDIFSGKIVCVGDSYLQGYTPDGSVESWGEKIKKKYPSTILKAEGGSGWKNKGRSNHDFSELIDMLEKDDTVSLIIIAGGYNDMHNTSLGVVDVKRTVDAARLKFVNATVVNILCGYGKSANPYGRINAVSILSRYSNIYGNALFADITQNLKADVTKTFASDYIHVNDLGQEIIANSIINFLNGSEIIQNNGRYTLKWNGEKTGEHGNMIVTVENGFYVWNYYSSTTVQFPTGVVTTGTFVGLEIEKITIPFNGGGCASGKYCVIQIPNAYIGIIIDGSTHYVPCIMWLESTDVADVWSLKASVISKDEKGFFTGDCRAYIINPFSILIPLSSM